MRRGVIIGRTLLSFAFTAACVRPYSELSWFARAGVHDGDNGCVAAVATSFDDTFVLSAGHDGVICVLLLRASALEEEAAMVAPKAVDISPDFMVCALRRCAVSPPSPLHAMELLRQAVANLD